MKGTNFFRIVYTLYAFTLFACFTLIAFPLVIIFSFFGRIAGGNAICSLAKLWGSCWYFLIGIRHHNIFESEYHPEGTYIFVSNHISYLDIPSIFMSVRKQTFRVLGKAEMNKIPVFGFIYRRGAVTVDRSSSAARARSVRELKKLLSRHISVFIFPEGTFNETGEPLKDFFDGAFRIAIQTQTPIKPILFLDNYTLMNYHSVLSARPGRSRTVFLEEISPEGYGLSDIGRFRKQVYDLMDRKLREYQASWIRHPQGEHS
ncbi:MAG TPA: lysophospholipid acyltransferase family protein [Puia sp.]|nr:lysophospholipid acyltransferase family protein [Puia sp.]